MTTIDRLRTAAVHDPDRTDRPWWSDAVIYQVYPRSFADSSGDGIGDLPGVTAHLDHLVELGVDALWLSPFYRSPQADAGYDVADYRDVDPLFGTLADVDTLLARAHELGLRVIVDLVPNHTSDQHTWFRTALAAAPGSPERDRYLFRDGRGAHGELPPNNWRSMFGGPAWTRVAQADGQPGQWYLHLFDPGQPDLDWGNVQVRAEFVDVLRFWLDRGVDGFRVDVAHGLVKTAGLPDWDGQASPPMFDQEGVHEIYREWHRVLAEYDGDRMLVAEAWVEPLPRLARYVRPDEMHQAFNFAFLDAGWDAARLREVVTASYAANDEVGAPTTWVLSNHDVVRHASRLGLPEHTMLDDAVRQDPAFRRTGGAERGRDGARVPMPWQADAPAFGFSPTGASWLPQPASWAAHAVDVQRGRPGSTYELYRQALAVRRVERLGSGGLSWVDLPGAEGTVAFVDRGILVVTNLGPAPVRLPDDAQVLLASTEPGHDTAGAGLLPVDATVWVRPAR